MHFLKNARRVSWADKQKEGKSDQTATGLDDGMASARGIGIAIFFDYFFGNDAIGRFHIMGPSVVMLKSGTVAFESLVLGESASGKIGYSLNRAYQIQSGLANAATALTAMLVYALDWGRYADATIVLSMLLFFTFSAANHTAYALMEGNRRPINALRPVMAVLLICFLLSPMIKALSQ
jgi:hypothetical protein